MIMMALFIALSIVLGKQLSFTAGPFRISFENLTVLMAGIFFGPLAGLTVGACADLFGCLLVGYAINPIITAVSYTHLDVYKRQALTDEDIDELLKWAKERRD